ncbi:MAG TPA: hypothetical protein VEK15_32870 [Vicinamibacteria bacterium]|nr:hypothetical protein [Vicinamibacteria bacterium]
MSKHKNVHPDHYKTGGSAHQGEDVVHAEHKKELRKRAEREKPPPPPRDEEAQ